MDSKISEILANILSGEASQEDKHTLIQWLAQDPENLKAFRQSETLLHAIRIISSRDQFHPAEAFERFKSNINQEPEKEKSGLMRSLDLFLRIAAVIVLAVGLSLWLLHPGPNKADVKGMLSEVTAPSGSKAQVVLPDGTKVWLNAESRINYQRNFGSETREVYLEGEAYFEVAKDPDKPFIVNTSEVRVKALGTSFNVKSYPADEMIVTTLIEGKVVLEQKSKADKAITLVPDQQLVVYKPGAKKTKPDNHNNQPEQSETHPKVLTGQQEMVLNKNVNTEITTAWKNNYLYFEDETFRDIAIELERRFGVSIRFKDEEIARYRYAGKFQDVIIEQVLLALQYASPFEYSIKDKNIIIYNSTQKTSK